MPNLERQKTSLDSNVFKDNLYNRKNNSSSRKEIIKNLE
jgi:hypothetical protein